MTGNRVSYTLDSTLDSVNTAEQKAEEIATRSGFEEDDRHRIAMAVREAVVNAVLHGNAYDARKKVTIAFENTGRALIIRITDQGKGFKNEQVPNPLAPENLMKGSGRGIFLIRSFMDDVSFSDLSPGTQITLVKYIGVPLEGVKEGSK